MSFEITIALDNPSVGECPTTLQELNDSMNARLHGSLEGSFLPYVTGAATPSVEDQDKIWARVDAQGRPLGMYFFYNGVWRKQYSGNTDEVRFFTGDPADFFDATGLGIIGSSWDGWALMNGGNGTNNLSNRFLVGAKMDDLAVGYNNGPGPWSTTVSGTSLQLGGVKDITLSAADTYRPATDAITLGHWSADTNTPNAAGGLIGLSGGGADFNLIDADAGNPTPPAIPTLPPYYACALCQFVGY